MNQERSARIISIMMNFINELKAEGVSMHLINGEYKFGEDTGITFDLGKKLVILAFQEGGEPKHIPMDYLIESVFGKEVENEKE